MRSLTFRLTLFAVLLLPSLVRADSFTPAQRGEIVAIVRDALKQDPSILRDAVASLQEDDTRQQHDALAGVVQQFNGELTAKAGDPVAGNPMGRITLVEFSDVRCPYCRRMVPVLAALVKANPDLRIVYKDLPVLGPASVLGAKAELAANKQNAYLKMHEVLMSGTQQITEELVKDAAGKLGVNWTRLESDMKSQDVADRIESNLAMAHRLEFQGTPGYVLGDTLLPGAVSQAELQKAIDQLRKGG